MQFNFRHFKIREEQRNRILTTNIHNASKTHEGRNFYSEQSSKVKVDVGTLTFTGEEDLLTERVLDLVSITRFQPGKCLTHNITNFYHATVLPTSSAQSNLRSAASQSPHWSHTMGRPIFTPKAALSPSTITTPSNTPIPQPTPLTIPNGIRIHSAMLPLYTFRTDRQSDRQTDGWARRHGRSQNF